MGEIYIRTYAYNAEKTLVRTIESVLKQTHKNFIYYLCDNGSTDGTSAIIADYAKRDSRIRPFYNSVNRALRETEECLFLPYNIADDDYFCSLDADDEYKPTFIEEMLIFMDKNNLDIGVCGSDFLSVAQNNQLIGQRLINQNLILEGSLFQNYFIYYHVFMRTTWGKLYRGFTLKNTVQDPSIPGSKCPQVYGGDTYNAMQSFSSAKRVGIYAKSLHLYYVNQNSSSYKWNHLRVKSDQMLHSAALEYLSNYGKISEVNMDFLFQVYLYALKDTCNILFNSKTQVSEIIDELYEIFSCDYTKQLIIFEASEDDFLKERKAFVTEILEWILSLEEVDDREVEKYCTIGELLSAFLDYAEGWTLFNKIRINYLLNTNRIAEAGDKLDEIRPLIPEDQEILEFIEKYNDLKCEIELD